MGRGARGEVPRWFSSGAHHPLRVRRWRGRGAVAPFVIVSDLRRFSVGRLWGARLLGAKIVLYRSTGRVFKFVVLGVRAFRHCREVCEECNERSQLR